MMTARTTTGGNGLPHISTTTDNGWTTDAKNAQEMSYDISWAFGMFFHGFFFIVLTFYFRYMMHSFSDIRRVFNDDGQDNDRGQWENEQQNSSTLFFHVFLFNKHVFISRMPIAHATRETGPKRRVSRIVLALGMCF